MIGKKINQLATELTPASTDLTIIGNPTTGVSKKITLAQLGAIFSGAVSFYTNLAAFPTPGTTDVIYCAKDTQKLYLWSGSAYVEVFPSQALLDTYQLRSEKGNANGYASLDSQGKVPISQLPSSIMEYKGTWNASTNTPTLANGTGDTGDVFICNVSGTVNFGAGPITFAVGDYVIYSGTIWQRSSGAVGTVTSVAASITGNAIGITGSPVTTSGTLAFAFAGNSTQYVNGAGNLVTFPGVINEAQNLITEVYNKTGATLTKGTVVYINGGQGNLPTITKALASADATSAQTYGIVRNDITNNNNGYVVVAGRISDLDTQAYTEGTQLYLSSTTAGTYTSTKQYAPNHLVYVGVVVRAHPTQGVVEVKIQNGYELDELHNVAAQTPSNNDGLFWESATSLWKNKSIATILGGTPVIGSGTTNFVSKFTASSTIGSSQIWDNGTSVLIGTTGSLPGIKVGIYSSTQRALEVVSTNANALFVQSPAAFIMSISNGTWITQFTNTGRLDLAGDLLVNTIANATTDTDRFLVSDSGVIKYRTGAELLSDIGGQPSGTYVTSVGLSVPTGFAVSGSPVTSSGTLALAFDTGYSLPTIVKQNNWDTAYNTRIVTASSPLSFISNTISISQASGSANGFLSSTDWTTFNNKQNALTNPVTGTGTTNYLPKFTGASTIGNSLVFDNGTNVGIGTATPYSATNYKFLTIDGTNGSGYVTRVGSVNSFLAYSNSAGTTLSEQRALPIVFETTGTSRMTLDASGNLGLGSGLSFTSWSNSGNIDLNDVYLSLSSAGTYGGVIANNAYYNGGWKYKAANYANLYQTTSGEHKWLTAGVGTAGNAISFTQAMTLNASGRLGIGTTSPDSRLHVGPSNGAQLRIDFVSSGDNYYDGVTHYFRNGNGAANIMTLLNSGNVGIGTTSPSRALHVLSGVGTAQIQSTGTTSHMYFADANSSSIDNQGFGSVGNNLWFSAGGFERMRITSGGALKQSSTGSFASTDLASEFNSSQNLPTLRMTQSRTSGGEEMLRMVYSQWTPNNSSSWFIYANDLSAARFYVRSDGGIGNYQANDVNLSDIRTKKDITPLGSYWDKFKAIEMVKFKYKDQTHDDFNIGVIAQQVEKVAPEFVDVDGWGDTPKDGVPLKSIYTADLHHATIKVLQEAMAKIEDLQNQLDILKNK
jgi:ribosomal protein L35AE/L33A